MPVEIRSAGAPDIGAVREIAEAAWAEAHAPIVGQDAVESFLDEFYTPEAFESVLATDEAVFVVAEVPDAGVVGFADGHPDDDAPDTFQLGRIYVAPDRWGDGIGSRLLEAVEDRVRDHGHERVALGVMAENNRAVAFYESKGYSQADTFYDDRLDTAGYTYVKAL